MSRTTAAAVMAAVLSASSITASRVVSTADPATPPPHVVYFLVDDLGYANVGYTAPEPKEPLTPYIDALASSGLRLENYYTYKFCSPTRSSFISGRLPIHVNQQNHPPSSPGGGVPVNMTTIADKLQSVGYSTHQVGKWHCGMSGLDRVPTSRGFNSSFGYLAGAEDHYTNLRDGHVDLWRDDSPAYGENNTDYATYMYTREAMRILEAYNPAKRRGVHGDNSVALVDEQQPGDQDSQPPPLFLYMAYQSVHAPLQVPSNWTDLYPNITYGPRKNCQAMISAVDMSIGTIVDRLHAYDMYNNTLIIFSSDNGGPPDHANNYPLRGAKGDDFQGGVRVCAALNGGFLPDSVRGTTLSTGLIHIADWYATLGGIAGYNGTDDPAAAASGLPPVRSFDELSLMRSCIAAVRDVMCSCSANTLGVLLCCTGGFNRSMALHHLGFFQRIFRAVPAHIHHALWHEAHRRCAHCRAPRPHGPAANR